MFSTLAALSLAALLSGCGQNSTPTGVTALDETAPAAPSQLLKESDPANPNGLLAWEPSTSANVAGYEVYQYAPDPAREDAYVLVGQTDGTITEYALPFSYQSQTVYYRLKAVSTAGIKSSWSATAGIGIGPNVSSEDPQPGDVDPTTQPIKGR
jgi:hypothetical protein